MVKSNVPQRHPQSTSFSNVLFLLAAFMIPVMRAPTLRHPLPEPYIHPTYPLRILSSVQSTTGLIVVGEALPLAVDNDITPIQSMRYLRASHSLLGGVWIGNKAATKNHSPPVSNSEGTLLGDSVYAAFVLQEAVRLVNNTDSEAKNILIM